MRGNVVIQKTEPALATDKSDPSRIGQDPTVFVDVREFRSELPALLHRKGMKVIRLGCAELSSLYRLIQLLYRLVIIFWRRTSVLRENQ